MKRRLGTVPLFAATAILAAAVGNPLVEAVSSSGLLGAGYHDLDRSSALPASIVGLLIALAAVVLRTLREWRGTRVPAFPERAVSFQLPLVVGLQLLAVYAMQTFESLSAHGRPADLSEWLGGPAWFSLAVYAVTSLICSLFLRRLMGSFVTKIVGVLREAERFLSSPWLAEGAALIGRSLSSHAIRALEPGVRRTRGRAPPHKLDRASL